jgi:hypothetical protein
MQLRRQVQSKEANVERTSARSRLYWKKGNVVIVNRTAEARKKNIAINNSEPEQRRFAALLQADDDECN